MSKKDDKKLYVNPWRIIGIFAIAYVIFEAIFYVTFQGANGKFWPFDKSFYFYTPLLFVATAIFCYISLTQTFYQIDGATFIHSKMGKITEYARPSLYPVRAVVLPFSTASVTPVILRR